MSIRFAGWHVTSQVGSRFYMLTRLNADCHPNSNPKRSRITQGEGILP